MLDKITLRPILITDVPAIVKHVNNPAIINNLPDNISTPFTQKNAEDFICYSRMAYNKKIDAITYEDELIGMIGIESFDWKQRVEIGFWLAQPYWNKGIMSQSVSLMMKYAFDELGIKKLTAKIYEHNEGSIHVLKKLGFKEIEKDDVEFTLGANICILEYSI